MADFFLNEFIVNIDVAIYQFVDSIMNPVLDVIFTFITHLGDTPGIIWFILGICLLIPKKTRKLGVIRIGLYGEDNIVEWKYIKKVTDSLNPFSYVYSCITELSDGSIVDLYESDKAEFSLKGYTIDELKVNDKTKLSLVDSIKSKIYNKTRKNL